MSTNDRMPSSPDLTDDAAPVSAVVLVQREADEDLVLEFMSCLAPPMGSSTRLLDES